MTNRRDRTGIVRLETWIGGTSTTGPGHFHRVDVGKVRDLPLLVTTRRVVEGRERLRLHLPPGEGAAALDHPHLPGLTFYHPDPSVDLAAIFLAPVLTTHGPEHLHLHLTRIEGARVTELDIDADLSAPEEIPALLEALKAWVAEMIEAPQ